MRILVIGDFHIPTRAHALNPVIKYKVEGESFDLILCTGDLVSPSVLEWLQSLASKVYIVRGNMDYLPLPRREVMEIKGIRIGLVHGHEVRPRGDVIGLTRLARSLSVSILVHGHTHTLSIDRMSPNHPILLNPGSATGVWSGGGGSLIPSFMIVELLSRRTLRVLKYELRKGRLEESSEFLEV